MTFVKKIRKIS